MMAMPRRCRHACISVPCGCADWGHCCAACAQDASRARCLPDGTLLVSVSAGVRAAGPREWLSLETLRGEIQARLYLLPDTDFCQWDALCARLPCRNDTLEEACQLGR